MFDKNHYNYTENREIVTMPDTIHKHVHKAPTDDSVRLLNEMQEKARQNIIVQIETRDNLIQLTALAYYQTAQITAKHKVLVDIKFSINGKQFLITENVEYDALTLMHDRESLAMRIKDLGLAVVVKYITRDLQEQMVKQILEKNNSF